MDGVTTSLLSPPSWIFSLSLPFLRFLSQQRSNKSPPPLSSRDYLTRVKTSLKITSTIDRFEERKKGEEDKVASEAKMKQKKGQFFSPPFFFSSLPSRFPVPPSFPPSSLAGRYRRWCASTEYAATSLSIIAQPWQ